MEDTVSDTITKLSKYVPEKGKKVKVTETKKARSLKLVQELDYINSVMEFDGTVRYGTVRSEISKIVDLPDNNEKIERFEINKYHFGDYSRKHRLSNNYQQ